MAAEAIGCVLATKPPRVDRQQEWVITPARLPDDDGTVVCEARGRHHTSGKAARADAYCTLLEFAVDRITHKVASVFKPSADGEGIGFEALQRYLCDRRDCLQRAARLTSRRARLRVLGLRATASGGCEPL